MKIITLLTDFGLKDPYAGIVKGVILSINPDVTIVDVTHEVDPQDIREGAFIVEEHYRYFPDGTIHLCVVDPTVGSGRRPIIVTRGGHFFVGPDNGLFTLIYQGDYEAHAIENPDFMLRDVSSTFHGRDVFAPIAAHLTKDFHPSAFGRAIFDTVRFADIFPVVEDNRLVGEVVRFDRFGNAITNIHANLLGQFIQGRPFTITINDMSFAALNRSYYEGDCTCLIGSSGYLEFGCYRGSFLREKHAVKGNLVYIRPGAGT